jgi:hypothetical protein
MALQFPYVKDIITSLGRSTRDLVKRLVSSQNHQENQIEALTDKAAGLEPADPFTATLGAAADADYEHGLGTQHLGILGTIEELDQYAAVTVAYPVDSSLKPNGNQLDVSFEEVDDDTINIKNHSGGTRRVKLKAFTI